MTNNAIKYAPTTKHAQTTRVQKRVKTQIRYWLIDGMRFCEWLPHHFREVRLLRLGSQALRNNERRFRRKVARA